MKYKSYIKLILAIILILFLVPIIFIMEPIIREEKTIVSYAAKKDLVQSVMADGIVEASDKEEITVNNGQLIKKLYVEKDGSVNKGEVLFILDQNSLSKDIKSKEIELKKAELELENIKALSLEKDNTEKQLALKEMEFNVMKLKASVDEMSENLDMSRTMYGKGHLSKKEMETVQYNYNKALAEFELLENRYEMEKEKNKEFVLNYDKNKKDKEEILYKNIEIIKLQLDELNNKAKETNTASINGKIIHIELKEGDKVNSIGPHILIYDLSELFIDITISQKYASNIQTGDIAEITMEGIKEDKLYGSVYSIEEIADVEYSQGRDTGLRVKVKINNPSPDIKVGYRADVKLIFNSKENAVAVDYRAIVKDRENNKFIYIIKDGIANRTYVETGINNDFEVEITKGVIKGDQYIVNPSEKMREKNSFRLWRYEMR